MYVGTVVQYSILPVYSLVVVEYIATYVLTVKHLDNLSCFLGVTLMVMLVRVPQVGATPLKCQDQCNFCQEWKRYPFGQEEAVKFDQVSGGSIRVIFFRHATPSFFNL